MYIYCWYISLVNLIIISMTHTMAALKFLRKKNNFRARVSFWGYFSAIRATISDGSYLTKYSISFARALSCLLPLYNFIHHFRRRVYFLWLETGLCLPEYGDSNWLHYIAINTIHMISLVHYFVEASCNKKCSCLN